MFRPRTERDGPDHFLEGSATIAEQVDSRISSLTAMGFTAEQVCALFYRLSWFITNILINHGLRIININKNYLNIIKAEQALRECNNDMNDALNKLLAGN